MISGSNKQNLKGKKCLVKEHLKDISRRNYKAALAIDGVSNIIEESDGFIVEGEKKAVNEACNLLRIVEKIFFVPIGFHVYFENNKKSIDIKKQSRINEIKVIRDDDENYKGLRFPNSVPLVLVGRSFAVHTAEKLLSEDVDNWNRSSKSDMFSQVNKVNTKKEDVSSPNECEIKIPKDLMNLAIGELVFFLLFLSSIGNYTSSLL